MGIGIDETLCWVCEMVGLFSEIVQHTKKNIMKIYKLDNCMKNAVKVKKMAWQKRTNYFRFNNNSNKITQINIYTTKIYKN